jgi:hypothetical protein
MLSEEEEEEGRYAYGGEGGCCSLIDSTKSSQELNSFMSSIQTDKLELEY